MTSFGRTPAQTEGVKHIVSQLVALISELAVLVGANETTAHDLLPASWFTAQTLLTPDQLRSARRRGLIRCELRGSRWYYSVPDARRLFPDRWCHPDTGRPVEGG